jgi:hypothetical protein
MRAVVAALLVLAAGACDDREAERARTDAGGGATGCYETHPLEEYCERDGALCGMTLETAVTVLCTGAADAGASAAVERTANSCGGTTLSDRSSGAARDYNFTATGDFIGTTSFADDARPGCEQGTSATYGAPCDPFEPAQPACE